MVPVFALGGDAASAPEDTLVGYWAAIAAGADGLAVHVQSTRDAKLVCAPFVVDAAAMSLVEVLARDAGAEFRASALDASLRRSSSAQAAVWAGSSGRRALRHPELSEVLRVFGRRTPLVLRLAELDPVPLVQLLARFGLQRRVRFEASSKVGRVLMKCDREAHWIARLDGELDASVLNEARSMGARGVSWTWSEPLFSDNLGRAAEHQLGLWLRPSSHALGVPGVRWARDGDRRPEGVFTAAVAATASAQRPLFEIFRDALQTTPLSEQWTGGYARLSREARILQEPDGLHIALARGTEYAGGAIVWRTPIPGDFAASVTFRVKAPQPATTFELAAIAVDPGRRRLDPTTLTHRDVHLSFDVHGAPPYASSERDEADGFRFGWSCASNLTRIDAEWNHASANMYNQYGRDVGDGAARGDWTAGELRLVRRGQLFASYFRDDTTPAWVCSGAGLVSTMPHDVFLRLAAKHWKKGGVPPANEVVFSNFVVQQP